MRGAEIGEELETYFERQKRTAKNVGDSFKNRHTKNQQFQFGAKEREKIFCCRIHVRALIKNLKDESDCSFFYFPNKQSSEETGAILPSAAAEAKPPRTGLICSLSLGPQTAHLPPPNVPVSRAEKWVMMVINVEGIFLGEVFYNA